MTKDRSHSNTTSTLARPSRRIGRRGFVVGTTAATVTGTASKAEAAPNGARRKILGAVRTKLRSDTTLDRARVRRVVNKVDKLLPKLKEVSFGHVVIGAVVGSQGEVLGLTGCGGGHACGGTFDGGPAPGCDGQGSLCTQEACSQQVCSKHWCRQNVCETETCSTNLCEGQTCDAETCTEKWTETETTSEASTKAGSDPRLTPGWKAVLDEVRALEKAKKLKITVSVHQVGPGDAG
jgi:hypothetical protein